MIWRCSISCLVVCSLLLVGSPVQRAQSPLDEAMTSITNDLARRGTLSWTSSSADHAARPLGRELYPAVRLLPGAPDA